MYPQYNNNMIKRVKNSVQFIFSSFDLIILLLYNIFSFINIIYILYMLHT
jgi:hypothetical protein